MHGAGTRALPGSRGRGARDCRHFLSARTAPRVTGYSLRTQGRSGSRRHWAQWAPALPALRSGPHPARARALPWVLGPRPSEDPGVGLARPGPGPPRPAPGPEGRDLCPSPALVPVAHAHREAPRGREGRTPTPRSDAARRALPASLPAAPPGPAPPTGPQPGGGGAAHPSLTWLLVVVADDDEVIGQPRHGRRRRAREAGARRRPRRRRPPGPGGLSIFPAAAAATLQPCLTPEARSAPAPRPRRPSPTRRPGPGRSPPPPSAGGRSPARRARSPRYARHVRPPPQREAVRFAELAAPGWLAPASPSSIFPRAGCPSFRPLCSLWIWVEETGMVAGSPWKVGCFPSPPPPRRDPPALSWKRGICTARALAARFLFMLCRWEF